MPALVRPTPTVMASFLEAMEEFAAEGAKGTQTTTWIQSHGDTWRTPDGFVAFTERINAEATNPAVLPPGWVLTTTRWLVEGETYLGRIAVRHELNAFLADVGGHIGYDVRPSARRQGHATTMLRDVLPVAAGLGIDPALVTCDDDNTGSIKVIEACGGVLEDIRGYKRRYWVPSG
ncbi:GNAT family N-acetyltransferase [Nocardioides sp. AE5]|uniref:GNAT family N-acetyltransferase n=1 Tax=Nocardioides sp. AE5 TaxID=2962573 RepID=UPI0028817318|nr:GNAT family N-acetyltransferase [Nocardioides sp. AE5]MDT0201069.1 GNAT family N-acetyltransferase [Nocardioides sp. AE5]